MFYRSEVLQLLQKTGDLPTSGAILQSRLLATESWLMGLEIAIEDFLTDGPDMKSFALADKVTCRDFKEACGT